MGCGMWDKMEERFLNGIFDPYRPISTATVYYDNPV
jgi:hypothetical protein